MEEKLEKKTSDAVGCEDGGKCHTGSKCMDMHKLCFTHCCMLKCIAAVIVLSAVFMIGYCSGAHGEVRHHMRGYQNYERQYGNYEQYGSGYRGMMGEGQNYGRHMMYRVDSAPTITLTTSAAPTNAVPAVVQ